MKERPTDPACDNVPTVIRGMPLVVMQISSYSHAKLFAESARQRADQRV
jgi:hypothetical protein